MILLARQRSGTNALRSILESNPDIFCLNEVFDYARKEADDPVERHTNYFNFLTRYTNGTVQKLFPDNQESLFLDFLDFLGCFSPKRYVVIDIKYNTTHFFTKKWSDCISSPYLFELMKLHRLPVLHVKRRHYLRYIVSILKAWNSGTYHVSASDQSYSDTAIELPGSYALEQLEACYREDRLVEQHFSTYEKYFSIDYADVFPDASGTVSSEFLQSFSAWVGVPNSFTNSSRYRKQAHLTLTDTISNYEEVASVLKGTRFEYCLREENPTLTDG